MIKSLKDGDKVLVSGGISVYAKRGSFQIIVRRIAPLGKGDLKEKFEQLKRKLAADGLFDIDQKKELPLYPRRVAVITAPGAAALQDFLNIINRRSIWMDVVLVPSLVQGDLAPASIRKALEKSIRYSLENKDKAFDVIILTRGGGSSEDLWAFNDEGLAWDIYNCPIPVVSAVGHQVDYTICDFVADKRLETPSAAAEVLTNEQTKITERVGNVEKLLHRFSSSYLTHFKHELLSMNPSSLMERIYDSVMRMERRLKSCDLKHRAYELTSIHEHSIFLDDLHSRLMRVLDGRLERYTNLISKHREVLDALNPHNVLDRGFSYVEDPNGNVISSVDDFNELEPSLSLNIQFKDGKGLVKKVSSNG